MKHTQLIHWYQLGRDLDFIAEKFGVAIDEVLSDLRHIEEGINKQTWRQIEAVRAYARELEK